MRRLPSLVMSRARLASRLLVAVLLLLIVSRESHCVAEEVRCNEVAGLPGGVLQGEYDVIVAGGGAGGLAAGMQAARMGASVLLVESTDWIGGQMTAAGVTSMDEGYPPRGRVRERGIYGEFCRRVLSYYQALGKSTDTSAVSEDHFAMEPHIAQQLLYEMIRDTRQTPLVSGKPAVLDLMLRSQVTAVEKNGNTVRGVTLRIPGRNGAPIDRSVKCRILIDATEYGDVIPLTGQPYRVGIWIKGDAPKTTESLPPVQPITWTASIKQYPQGLPKELRITQKPNGYDEEPLRASISTGEPGDVKARWSWERFLQYRGMPDSTSPFSAHNGSGLTLTRTSINLDANDQHMNVMDVEDEQQRYETEYKARLLTLSALYYIQNVLGMDDWSVATDVGYDTPYNREQNDRLVREHPDLASYREILNHFPVMPYVRESRRIIGVETLTATEIRRKSPHEPKRFHNAVAIGDYPVDVHGEHHHRELQVELDLDEAEDLPLRWIQWGYGPFQIPLTAFIPQELDGFLPAEKNLSQSRIASGATRLQPSTMLTGQAAGAIAGLACRLNKQPRELSALMVQCALLDARSTLSLTYYTDLVHGAELWKAVQLATLYQIVDFDEPYFQDSRRVNETEVAEACKRLKQHVANAANLAGEEPIDCNLEAKTRGELVRGVSRVLRETLPPTDRP